MKRLLVVFFLLFSVSLWAEGLSIIASRTSAPTWVFQSMPGGVTIDAGIRIVDSQTGGAFTGVISTGFIRLSEIFESSDQVLFPTVAGFTVSQVFNLSAGVSTWNIVAVNKTGADWQAFFRQCKYASTIDSTELNLLSNKNFIFSVGEGDTDGFFAATGHFYEVLQTRGSWTLDKAAAAARTKLGMTGYLATVTSAAENDFIFSKMGFFPTCWIGIGAPGLDTRVSSNLKWTAGPEINVETPFTNWNSGASEPDNRGFGLNHVGLSGLGNFVQIANGGLWQDNDELSTDSFAVEYGSNPPASFSLRTGTIKLMRTIGIGTSFGAIF